MGSISNSYKNNPNHVSDDIPPLDFNSVVTVPDSHKWEDIEPHSSGSVPLVDLSDPNAKSLIREACEKWGALQVINHGIPMSLFKQVELEAFRLFSLPHQHKLCARRTRDGVTGYGVPRISRYFSKFLWCEGFTMLESPAEYAAKLWPHQPDQQTSFCTAMEECQKEMKRETEKLMELMLESLGFTAEDLEWFKPKTDSNKAQALFALNSYPICPEPEQAMGLGPHSDTSLLTVLFQSSCTGLQVFRDGIGWIPVPPIPGALTVNVGDLMHVLSNGRFKNVLHRAVVNNTHHRISAAYIYGPPTDVKISPLTKLTDPDHPPLYSPVTWNEIVRAKAIHYNNALEVIKIRVE